MIFLVIIIIIIFLDPLGSANERDANNFYRTKVEGWCMEAILKTPLYARVYAGKSAKY